MTEGSFEQLSGGNVSLSHCIFRCLSFNTLGYEAKDAQYFLLLVLAFDVLQCFTPLLLLVLTLCSLSILTLCVFSLFLG